MEDTHLFQQAVAGVKRINNSNVADVKIPRARKVDAQTLAKRAAAEGGRDTEHAELSDTQAAFKSGRKPSNTKLSHCDSST